MTSSLRKVVCMFRIKFPTKRIFRIFPILRTDGMAPFGTYSWNDPRTWVTCISKNLLLDINSKYYIYINSLQKDKLLYVIGCLVLRVSCPDDTVVLDGSFSYG